MGLFDKVAGGAGSAIKLGNEGATWPQDLLMGKALDEGDMSDSPEEIARRGYVEAAAGQRHAMADAAKTYRRDLPNLQNAMFSQYNDSARRKLAGSLSGVNNQMSQRGLLHSGLNQRAQAGTMADYASDLSRQRGQINEQTLGVADKMDNQAMGAGFQEQKLKAKAADQAYEDALARRQSRDGAVGGFFGSVGGILGKMAGM